MCNTSAATREKPATNLFVCNHPQWLRCVLPMPEESWNQCAQRTELLPV
jgi:hypothetical protein